jgi:hypothetical protein
MIVQSIKCMNKLEQRVKAYILAVCRTAIVQR